MTMGITVRSEWRGDAAAQGAMRGGATGLNVAGEYLRGKSVEQAPVDTVALRNSAAVLPASPRRLESGVSYDTPYAVRQHEDDELYHTPGANGESAGKSHFLVDPLNFHQRELGGLIARGVRDGIAAAV